MSRLKQDSDQLTVRQDSQANEQHPVYRGGTVSDCRHFPNMCNPEHGQQTAASGGIAEANLSRTGISQQSSSAVMQQRSVHRVHVAACQRTCQTCAILKNGHF